ncbi:hypothetical protein M422DRAFT_244029 [Sphaerobolus stellatus SS14]|nr:hypothetical protein M422DRAFT_244029 [Sphaerobolus stellatus SS14]
MVGTRRTQAVNKDADPPPATQAKKRDRPRKTQPELTAATGAMPKSSSVPLPGMFTSPIGIAGMMFTPQTTMARSGILVVLVRLQPMFDHPFLSEVLNLVVFYPSIRNPLPVRFKDKFDPLPLPVVAYTCTLIHCALKSLLKELQEDSPDKCQEALESLLAEGRKSLGETQEAICTNKRTHASFKTLLTRNYRYYTPFFHPAHPWLLQAS